MRLAGLSLLLTAALVAVLSSNAAPAIGATTSFYVSPTGSDDNDGSQAHPFKTIHRAQKAVQSAKSGGMTGDITVFLNGGTYSLAEEGGLVFTSADGGTDQYSVTYTSVPGQRATVTGGIVVPGWTQDSGKQTWTAKAPANASYARQMWANNIRQYMARSPTMAYEKATPNSIIFKDGQISGVYSNLDDVHLVLYESWTASLHEIASIDMSARNITLKTHYNNQWSGSAAGSRYYVENAIEELDYNLEFYMDRASGVISWYPPRGINPAKATVVIPQVTELVSVKGNATAGQMVTNLHFSNIDFRHAAMDVSDCFSGSCDAQSADFLTTAAVHFVGASNCTVSNVTVANVGGYAVWFDEGTFNNTLSYSHLYDLGAGGVRVGKGIHGVVADPTQRSEGNVVTDNVLEDGGNVYQEGCGVLAQAVAHTVIQHNDIRNFSYTGVSVGWNWGYADTSSHDNLVAFNNIQSIGLGLLSDMGCVYTLGKQPGSRITNNVCHKVNSYNYGGWGLYTDEGSSYILEDNNIVYHTKCAGLHQHYGEDNLFQNNVFAENNLQQCDGALRSSQHDGTCNPSAPDGTCSSFKFMTNIVYQQDGAIFYSTKETGFQNMTFDNNTYFKIDGSSVVFPMKKTFQQWKAENEDVHSVIADPQFVNPVNDDFSHLKPSSPSLKLGFKPIDTSTVGPRKPPSTMDRDHFQARKLQLHHELMQIVPDAIRQDVSSAADTDTFLAARNFN